VEPDQSASPSAAGLARQLPPDVLAGLGAIGRVARALVGAGPLPELSDQALAELREALELEIAVLYLPAESGRRALVRYVTSAAGDSAVQAHAEVSFDEEAWRLAVASGVPLVFHEEASWLVTNPFEPPASSWLVLPLAGGGRLLGVVIAAAREPMSLDPTRATVLTLLGDLLAAGIAKARLRQEIERIEIERERTRLAAEVHDGLAQDLALARRELALLEAGPTAEQAEASLARLREAVGAAHELVRGRLKELSAPVPLGGVREAVAEVCARFESHGLPVRLHASGPTVETAPETLAALTRVLTEALANVERHAEASKVEVELRVEDERLTFALRDDGCGFTVDAVDGADEGHLGLTLMRRRALEAGGELAIHSAPGTGTRVWLRMPLGRKSSPAGK
jgi:signal transduction histidine kinase